MSFRKQRCHCDARTPSVDPRELPLAMLLQSRSALFGNEDAVNEEMIYARSQFKSVYIGRSMSKFAKESCDERPTTLASHKRMTVTMEHTDEVNQHLSETWPCGQG